MNINYNIKNITLEPTEFSTAYSNTKGRIRAKPPKNQKYAPFKQNLHTVATLNGMPDQQIFDKDFILKLARAKKFVTLELDESVKINNTGLFVILSTFSKEEYQNLAFDPTRLLKIFKLIRMLDIEFLPKKIKLITVFGSKDKKAKLISKFYTLNQKKHSKTILIVLTLYFGTLGTIYKAFNALFFF